MVSKIATIGLLALLVVALVGGSAYILLRPTEAAAVRGASGQHADGEKGAGQNRDEAAARQQGYGFQGGERDQGQSGGGRGRTDHKGGEGVGQGRQAGGERLGEGSGDHAFGTRLTLNGRAVELAGDELTLQTDDGVATMHLGPEWYWESEGITLNNGDEVELTGFYEGDTFKVAAIRNLGTQETVTLRDETGRPQWAGRGRGRRGSATATGS